MAQKCYNKACGKDFTENHDTACNYHPGAPVFHEGLKGWSCCKKRTTDFSEFLEMPGCTQGLHNPNKPSEDAQQKVKPAVPPPAPRPPSPPPADHAAASVDLNAAPTRLELKQSPSAKKTFEAMRHKWEEEAAKTAANGAEIAVGTRCVNKGCTGEYAGDSATGADQCWHHPGEPVFHEGMKYWSCCTRRTTDFQAFLDQRGCTSGAHKWRADAGQATQVKCRYDFFQGGETISLSIYAKNVDPEQSWVEIGPKLLSCHLVFEMFKTCDLTIPFYGVVDPSRCKAEVLATKIEVSIRKSDGSQWPQLEG